MTNLTSTPEWQALAAHAVTMRAVHLRDLFAGDPGRAERMQVEAAGWYLDYAKHRVSAETLDRLLALADARGLRAGVDAMFAGERVNVTEDRAALHVALRAPRSASIVVDGHDVVPDVHAVLDRMGAFAERIRAGKTTAIVNIGIGGSDLGPAMAYTALWAYSDQRVTVRYVANVDGADLLRALHGLDLATTLFVVASKTFTTVETLTNARAARALIVDAFGRNAVGDHFVAVSTNAEEVATFGIDLENMFEFWDWVGGRYSVWSAIGLSLMIAIGADQFGEMLAGAHAMDEHFRTAPHDQNVPVLMALCELWYRDFLDAQSQAVVPYSQVLELLPAYLQQLEMESNGKSVTGTGEPVDTHTGQIVWGTPGTNGQHAYFQLLHQGTALVPVDFIGCVRPQPGLDLAGHQDLLVANMLAQAEALAFGRTRAEVDTPARVMPGNRPSSVLLCDQLTPFALGALVAAYEHKVMTLGTLWGIDSFDQWGVELGKALAGRIADELDAGDDADLGHDPSTNALIRRYRSRRR